MSTVLKSLALVLCFGVAACGSVETASRASVNHDLATSAAIQPRALSLTQFRVEVPEHLRVSELNAYLPSGDIVWRGDPAGDRHAQVKAIFEAGLSQAQARMAAGTPVAATVTVRRFHALSEKARYTTGGVHHMVFDIALTDPATGVPLGPVRTVTTDLVAFGGNKAIKADARGETQKVRITRHLGQAVTEELTQPGGHQNARLGLIQAMNRGL
ncbi:hypothetical protein ROJ8625_01813 [Roseivivax jejudonensis]|uniref:Lipoprotein n=1 Tax=Roseivivax jejudonensis TaxID=1529041 RepID=A0A1X6Z2X2_9RHOB|nr:DUF6778 family protein [Roseivivax jejudonensis]SLN38963.1 hypothetical protein ROJ8625_01813 [Roseivivax jejudonensis]